MIIALTQAMCTGSWPSLQSCGVNEHMVSTAFTQVTSTRSLPSLHTCGCGRGILKDPSLQWPVDLISISVVGGCGLNHSESYQ